MAVELAASLGHAGFRSRLGVTGRLRGGSLLARIGQKQTLKYLTMSPFQVTASQSLVLMRESVP
jgi:hypothetical protein